MSSTADSVESRDQLIAVWTRLVQDRGGQTDTDNGVSRMWADSIFGFWNAVTLTGVDISVDDLSDQLSRAALFMRDKSQAGYLWLFEDLLSPQARHELLPRIAEAGFELAFSGRGMAGDLSIPEPHHPELKFRRVETDDDLVTYGEINARAYGMPPEAGPAALGGSGLWRNDAYAYIGYRDGRPVACAATIGGPDSLFLALVATMPSEMRRGYGEAVTRKAIYEGIKQTGQRRVVLHATQAGQPVYERIGYRTNTPIHFLQPVQH
ncbi:GNAT family N-acetyltransferase [Micromonospora sp. 15K316]|uniref:GNAT family N-acetyltransferase n=1 Tax=Micromonospora sp. 15K316 TaxID=2530376 RepID=UPI00104F3C8F|nr:GNAT family N-acetyltransferase [Micromonospora sp. 15K316]TDC37178.1 GNAT family N-acetyltransferase [Micromonospora sp. 15K316]